ncbi:Na+/H+ antiporter, partial [Burkholderia pseudomallei]
MSPLSAFMVVLMSCLALVALELLAKRLRLPAAAALLGGGGGIAFVRGLRRVRRDPVLGVIVGVRPLW